MVFIRASFSRWNALRGYPEVARRQSFGSWRVSHDSASPSAAEAPRDAQTLALLPFFLPSSVSSLSGDPAASEAPLDAGRQRHEVLVRLAAMPVVLPAPDAELCRERHSRRVKSRASSGHRSRTSIRLRTPNASTMLFRAFYATADLTA